MQKEDVSLHGLSTKLSISKSTLHSWINGVEPQGVLAVFKLAKHFDMALEELCFGSKPKRKFLSAEDSEPKELKLTLKVEGLGAESVYLDLGQTP